VTLSTEPTAPPGGGGLDRVARAGVASYGGVIFNAAANFVAALVVTRSLPLPVAGGFFEALAIFTVLSNVAELGADTGLLRFSRRYAERSPEELRVLFLAALVPPALASAVLTVVLVVAASAISAAMSNSFATAHVSIVSELDVMMPFLLPAVISSVALAGLRAFSLRLTIGLQYIALPLLRLVLLGVVVAVTNDLNPVVVAWVAPYALVAVASIVALVPHARAATHARDRAMWRRVTKEFWVFSAPRSLAGSFSILLTWIDVVLMGALGSAQATAIYAVAGRYATAGLFPFQALQYAITPRLAHLIDRHDNAGVRLLYRSSTWWIMLAAWPLLITCLVFAGPAMSLFGAGYSGGAAALAIICAATLLNTGTGCNGALALLSGDGTVNILASGLSLAVNVLLNFWLIPAHGSVGAALAWLAAIVTTSLVTSGYLLVRLGVTPFGREYVLVVAVLAAAFGLIETVVRFSLGQGPLGFLVAVIGSTVAYLALLWQFRESLHLTAFTRILRPSRDSSSAGELPA
jgi:O-antigen/teichoic acid export membrane protein